MGVSSGTAALFLALASLGIGPGDEVIVPAFTYIATALAVSYTGAKPVFVDIDELTYNIDVKKTRSAINNKTKAIIPVHLYGQMADMPQIIKLAKERGIFVIEDAAQAHGAKLNSGGSQLIAGSVGDIGCFSFYPTKNLGGMGDGGMITTNSESIYKKLLMLRDYGRISRYEHANIGYNSRLDTIQAAILRIKLNKLDAWNKLRIEAAGVYNRLLSGVVGIGLPYVGKDAYHIYHVYGLKLSRRDCVVKALVDNNAGAIIHYPIPLHLQPAYKSLGYKAGDFPVSEKLCTEIVSLPMFPHISAEQCEYVADIIKGVLSS